MPAFVTDTRSDLVEEATAVFSPDRAFRYLLTRRWGSGPAGLFVMLNPSTASATITDPTLRRCLHFARRERWPALVVANLFALRATNPAALSTAADPVGEHNDHVLAEQIAIAPVVVCAWGAHTAAGHRAAVVGRLLAGHRGVRCLGLTRTGRPRHPLYLPNTAALIPYSPKETT